MKIGILADSGRKVGLGHLGRCMALAEALESVVGKKAVFLSPDEEARSWIESRGFSWTSMDHQRWDIAIGDSYRFTKSDLRALRGSSRRLLLVDDLGLVKSPCDWVLNSAVYANKISYKNAPARGFLLGPMFHPLRKEFRAAGRPAPKRPGPVKDVLLAMGGGDGWGVLEDTMIAARNALPDARLHVVIGPMANALIASGKNTIIHRSPSNLKRLMETCDMAVAAGGQTLYELAFMGVPTVCMVLADNQRENVAGFEAAGAVLSAGSADNKGFLRRLESFICMLSVSAQQRVRMSQSGQKLVDGPGALRVATTIAFGGKAGR